MGRSSFVLLLTLIASPTIIGAQPDPPTEPPPPHSVLIRLSTPAAVSLDGGDVEVLDPALQSAVASVSQYEPRLVIDGRSDTEPLLVLETGTGESLSSALDSLRAVPCVVRAGANFYLVSDGDPSAPSDYYFQEDIWPYSPFTGSDPVNEYKQDWANCALYDPPIVVWDHSGKVDNFEIDHPDWGDNWPLQMTETNLAWTVTTGSKDVIVAIIDSGVDWQHPDLAPNMWHNPNEDLYGDGVIVSSNPGNPYAAWEFDTVDENGIDDHVRYSSPLPCPVAVDDLVGWRFHNDLWPGDPTLPLNNPNHGHCAPNAHTYGQVWNENNHAWVDENGNQISHGTEMASIIGAAHNGFGCAGVCPNVSIMAINAGKSIEEHRPNDPEWPTQNHAIGVAEMIEGLYYAVCNGADIINISLSYRLSDYPLQTDEGTQALLSAINYALDAGVIICSSAGNTEIEDERWPAAILGVLSCAAIRSNFVKATQSSYGNHVRFCAPSGERYETWPELAAFYGDEYMTAVKYGPPDPAWANDDLLPKHEENVPTGPIHTYWKTDGHTSGCAAQLSGAFALLKAGCPDCTRQQLITQMEEGADAEHVYEANPGLEGKLGAGMIRPYHTLTKWGGPRDRELPDVTWSGEIWVSADYTVPPGGTLTIEPGTTVHVANFDVEDQASVNPVVIQAERIYANGTDGARIIFEWFGPEAYNEGYDNRWELRNGDSSSAVIQLAFCEFQKLGELQAKGSSFAGEDSYVSNCIFSEDVGSASNSLFASEIELLDCEFGARWNVSVEDSVRIEGCRFEQTAATQEAKPSILGYTGSEPTKCDIVNCILRNAEVGIRWFGSSVDSLFLEDVLIEHDYVQGLQARGEIGVDIQGGCVDARYLTLRGYTIGVNRQQATGKFAAKYSSFTDCSYAVMDQNIGSCTFFGMCVDPGDSTNQGGYNVFDENSVNIANLHSFGQTVHARKNWWGSESGPPQGSFVGPVDPLYYLTDDPELPDPPDFAIMVAEDSSPFSVGRNFPNPFNPVTEFAIHVPAGGGQVIATVYDIRGRIVRRLLNKELSSGEHVVQFDGRDDTGEDLSSGMYLCRFKFKDHVDVVKATLVK